MVTAVVAWDATSFGRLDAAESITGWAATGSGATATLEAEYFYQGSNCISIKSKTGIYTLTYTSASTDMNTTPRAWLAKIIQTNKDNIAGGGIRLRIGSGASAYSSYDIFPTASDYPTLGGWVIVPIQPSISQWITANTGSPNHAASTQWVIETQSATSAKAENVGVDAVDVMDVGTGLTITRGDVASTNANFTDFITADEGTVGNRWGVVQTRDGILYVSGVLSVGNTTVNTVFEDSNKVLVFPDYRVSNGFCGLNFDASNTGSATTIDACVFNGVGDLYTSDDTRPDYNVTGTAGTIDMTAVTFDGFREATLTEAVTLNTCTFLNGLSVIQANANCYSTTVIAPTNAVNEGFFTLNNPTKTNNLTIAIGPAGGHVAELTTNGTYTLTDHSYTGYSTANGESNSTFYNNSTGLVTLNVVGGTTPTVRNGTSASTVINNSINLTLTGMQTGSEVRIYDASGDPSQSPSEPIDGDEDINGGVDAATVAAGGSSYSVTDTLTVVGGTGTAATLTVTAVDSGAVTAVDVLTAGDYSINPTNPVSVTGGGGSLATFNLTLSGEFTFSTSASALLNMIIFHLDYKEIRFSNYTAPTDDASIPVTQGIDRVYYNP